MIIECRKCRSLYDLAAEEPNLAFRCRCGDVLMVPDPDAIGETSMFREFVKRIAEEEGLPLQAASDPTRWEFQRGSARIVLEHDETDHDFTVESLILPVPQSPTKQKALFRKVLELNYRHTGEARFALRNDGLVVTFTRSTAGLDYIEFRSAIESVSRTSDDYDDELRADFLEGADGVGENGNVDLAGYEEE